MTSTTRRAFATTLLLAAGLALAACGPRSGGGASASPAADAPGGAELWGLHCGRCHNTRSPTVASDAEWEVVALHMQIRANLTAADTATILEFLQSGN